MFSRDTNPELANRPDLDIIDSEPWVDASKSIDRLINLQNQAFAADQLGDYQRFGSVLMEMSSAERDVNNHEEAASYAGDAARAFEKANSLEEAAAAHATAAREYRTLFSPELALASLEDVLKFTVGGHSEVPRKRLGDETLPTVRLLANFTSTFSGVDCGEKDVVDYPVVFYDKYPRPSRDAAQQFAGSLEKVFDLPLPETANGVSDVILYLSLACLHMSRRRFGLSGSGRSEYKFMSKALGILGFRLKMVPDSMETLVREEGETSLNDILSAHTINDLRYR